MSYSENIALFASLLFGIVIVPGMDMLLVLSNALTLGRRAGLAATFGIMLGGAVHTVTGAVGVGLVTRLAPWLFDWLLIVGAGYLAYIGVTLIRSSITIDAVASGRARTTTRAFTRGVLTCLLNPKAYLFVVAVYPVFLKPAFGPIWSQAVVMGVLTVAMQFTIYGGLALAAGRCRDFLVSSPRATRTIGRVAGSVFVVVALLSLRQLGSIV